MHRLGSIVRHSIWLDRFSNELDLKCHFRFTLKLADLERVAHFPFFTFLKKYSISFNRFRIAINRQTESYFMFWNFIRGFLWRNRAWNIFWKSPQNGAKHFQIVYKDIEFDLYHFKFTQLMEQFVLLFFFWKNKK